MNKLRINRHHFSKLFWHTVLQNSESFLRVGWSGLDEQLRLLEGRRTQAEYNTGSISTSTAFVLYALCEYFRPDVVAEVGTFIGKSTLSIAKALDDNPRAIIHTCDYSNAIDLDLPTKVKITQYKKQTSTQMFSALKQSALQVDLLALDGRISREDLALIPAITHEKTIITLDDFEGVEKGVANAMLLSTSAHFKDYLTIYPPYDSILASLGFMTGSVTAVLLPTRLLSYTHQ
jgi:hypothetical protein